MGVQVPERHDVVDRVDDVVVLGDTDTMGALNLYSTRSMTPSTTMDVTLAAVFATHAAVAMSTARREANLERKAAFA